MAKKDKNAGSEKDKQAPWFGVWAEKYAQRLGIESFEEDLTQEQKDEIFRDIGIDFINALYLFLGYDETFLNRYKPKTRDGKLVWYSFQEDIEQSLEKYRKRQQAAIDGANKGTGDGKGGNDIEQAIPENGMTEDKVFSDRRAELKEQWVTIQGNAGR